MLRAIQQRFADVRDVSFVAESSEAASSPASERIRRGGSLVQRVVRDEPIVGELIEALGLEFYE
jgi:methyl-accepting chemotaxis protein